MSVTLNTTWTEFKAVAIASKALKVQYYEDTSRYLIAAFDEQVDYRTTIWKSGFEPVGSDTVAIGVDRTDFTTNYAPTANQKLDTGISLNINGSSPVYDAFSRLRISEPFTLFDSDFGSGSIADTFYWDTSTATGGTTSFVANESSWNLIVNTTSGSSAIRQTKQYFSYQPGKGISILMTGVMGALKTNVRQRLGYFDANNGFYFEQDGVNLKVVRRTFVSGAPVENEVNQADWSLDSLDGSGPSGLTIDMSKIQIFLIDFQWLGAGKIRMGFDFGTTIVYCHEFFTANILTTVSTTTPHLPIRYEITNTGTTASSTTIKQTCATILSEGGYNPTGTTRTVDSGTTTTSLTSSSGTFIPLVAIRLKSANIRSTAQPTLIQCSSGNSEFMWRLILNPTTLTGPSWTSVSATSVIEFDQSATAISGGEIIKSGLALQYQVHETILDIGLRLSATISGTSDVFVLAAARVSTSANPTEAYGFLTFKEFV